MIDPAGGFSRLLRVLFPRNGGIVFAINAYFDESGDLTDPQKVFCVAGYFIQSDAAEAMDSEWDRVLNEHGLPYFHMVDCAHGNGVFAGKSKDERTEIVCKLIDLIKKYTLEGFSALAKEDEFEISDKNPDVYSSCVSACEHFSKLVASMGTSLTFSSTGTRTRAAHTIT